MSRDPQPGEGPESPEEPERPGPGRVRTTGAGPLVVFGLVGLVLGWLVPRVTVRVGGAAPTIGWLQVLALFFVAAVLGGVAWATYRTLHRRHQRLQPHQAVNRLVLAKACALAGAAVAGGYFGYALSWWGNVDTALDQDRVVRSVAAGVAGVLIVVASLLLERACRVSRDVPGDLP